LGLRLKVLMRFRLVGPARINPYSSLGPGGTASQVGVVRLRDRIKIPVATCDSKGATTIVWMTSGRAGKAISRPATMRENPAVGNQAATDADAIGNSEGTFAAQPCGASYQLPICGSAVPFC
jgi:hypothetical protein